MVVRGTTHGEKNWSNGLHVFFTREQDALWNEKHQGRLPFRCPRAVADLRSRGTGRDVCAPTRGRDQVERGPGQRGNQRDNVRCIIPAAVGFEHDGAQRDQRGRGSTCAHRPADESKSSEGQDSVATRGTTRDAMFLPRSGSSTTERSAISGGGARRVRTDPRTRPSRATARTDRKSTRLNSSHVQ